MATVPTDDVPAAHTSTNQWQSFEMRMRQRRIVRLLLRAQIAHEAGCDDEAREALAEAEELNEHAPGLAEMRAALEAPPEPPEAVPVVPAVAAAALIPAETPLARTELARTEDAFAELPAIPDVMARAEPAAVEPAADAPLAVAAPDAIAEAPAESREKRHWVPRVAAAALIVGALAWFAVPRAFRPIASTDRIADAPATVPAPEQAAAPQTSEPLEPPAPDELPAVRVAVDEVDTTPAMPDAPRQPAAAAASATALVGREIPEARSTTDAPEPAPPARIDAPESPALPPAIPVTTAAPLEGAPSGPLPDAPEPPRARAEAAVNEPARDAVPARAMATPDAGVRAILARYEAAYSRLDADAAGSVWPALDRSALARAFDGLASQRVRLGSCDVNVAGETAVAECSGSATWTPKVGGGTRTQARQWEFRLKYVAGGWQIVGTSVK